MQFEELLGIHFFIFSVVAAVLCVKGIDWYLPPAVAGEKRDQFLFLALPVVFELAYIASWFVGTMLQKVSPATSAGGVSPSKSLLATNHLPLLVVVYFVLGPAVYTVT